MPPHPEGSKMNSEPEPGGSAPGNPLAGGSGRVCNSDTPILAGLAREVQKDWLRAQALCLLAGFKADLIDGDEGNPMLVVSRWALTRAFVSPADVTAWLERVAPAVAAEEAP